LSALQKMADEGVTLKGGQIVSTTTGQPAAQPYDQWRDAQLASGKYPGAANEDQIKADYQTYVSGLQPTTTTTTTEGPYDITQSPYYPLYQFQQEQQNKAIAQNLSARGLYNSGKGIQEQVNADTGLAQSLTATEYQRAVDDYNRKAGIEGTLLGTGYGAAGNLASIYNSTGANKANVVQWGGGTLANLQTAIGTAKANAAIGQGTSLAGISTNAGNQLANINTQLGTNLANTTMASGQSQASTSNQLGTNLANIYMNSGTTQAGLLNQQAQNRMNMFAGAANTALYAYMRNKQPSNSGYNGGYSGYSNSYDSGWNLNPDAWSGDYVYGD
jgi:hypothetical protein